MSNQKLAGTTILVDITAARRFAVALQAACDQYEEDKVTELQIQIPVVRGASLEDAEITKESFELNLANVPAIFSQANGGTLGTQEDLSALANFLFVLPEGVLANVDVEEEEVE